MEIRGFTGGGADLFLGFDGLSSAAHSRLAGHTGIE